MSFWQKWTTFLTCTYYLFYHDISKLCPVKNEIMRTNTHTIELIIIFSIVLFSCQQDKEQNNRVDQGLLRELTDKVDSIGHEIIDQGEIMGLSIAIAKQGEVVYSNGFGTLP